MKKKLCEKINKLQYFFQFCFLNLRNKWNKINI